MTQSTDYQFLEKANYTELYQTCRAAGILVHPSASREDLIALLLGEIELPPDAAHPIDQWRDAVMSFLLSHWSVVASQLVCPAKSGDPRSCYQCADSQVMSCLVSQNDYDQHLIALRRK